MLSSRVKHSPHDFIFKQELGNGSYSRVYKVVDRRDSQKVFAVKVCSKQHIINENKVKYVTIEKNTLNLLARARHPGIVKLHSTFHDEENLYFVLDFAAGGELLSLLHRVGKFTEIWSRHFIAQLIDTIEFVHSQGVIHRDLKPENVLLHKDGRLMITDFGTATTVTNDDTSGAASFVGTADYLAPELLLYNRCQFGSDIWALGCMLYQFVQGVSPFRGDNELHTFEKIVSLEYPWADSNTGGVVSLVHRILTLDPSQRPNISSIKKDVWFDQIDWNNKELLWRGIWQVHPQRQHQLGLGGASLINDSNEIDDSNLPFSKPKKRKPAKVGNTTSSIVEWRKKLGIETFQTDLDRRPNTAINNTNVIKHNITTTNNKNTKSAKNDCIQKHEPIDFKPRPRGPLFKSPVKHSSANKIAATDSTQTSTVHFMPPHDRSKQISETTLTPMMTPPMQIHKLRAASPTNFNMTPNVTRPSTAPAFQQRRTLSPISKSRPSVQASISKVVSPLHKISPPHTVTSASSTPIPTSSSMPQLSGIAPMAKNATRSNNSPSNALLPKVSMLTQKLPSTLITSGKPVSLPPKTAPPMLSLDIDEHPRVSINSNVAAAVTGDRENLGSEILKQGFVHIVEIPYKNTGPDISIQSYKRIDNDLITKFVTEHKLELKQVDQPPSVLTLFENGILQFMSSRNPGVNPIANIGDNRLSMYDFEFYERQNRGFLILEKYHFKIWFISLPKANKRVDGLQLPIIGSDETWVDCIFRARQLVEDQGLVNKLNNMEVSSPRLSSPTIPVTQICSKPKGQSGGPSVTSNLSKRYVAPNNIVVTSSRPQVLEALNRNIVPMDASMGASVAFKSSRKK